MNYVYFLSGFLEVFFLWDFLAWKHCRATKALAIPVAGVQVDRVQPQGINRIASGEKNCFHVYICI